MTKSRIGSKKQNDFDVAIIGGGPAGISALLWARKLGFQTLLIEKEDKLGGQLHSIYNPITDYPGRVTKNGREMAHHFIKSIKGLEDSLRPNTTVKNLDVADLSLELNRGEIVHSRSLILAMGVRRRRLNIPGESEFTGKGILTSGAKEKHSVAGKRVVIVGGGDAALENAHILSEFAERVYIIHRRSEFRARPEFVSEARHNRLIKLIYDSVLSSIDGDASVRSVTIQNLKTHAQRVIPADAVLIRIGVQPNSELVQGQLELDRSGYVKTDHLCQTSQANVFAVGDIANPTSPTIATAAGNGATAIKAAAPLLNNSGDL